MVVGSIHLDLLLRVDAHPSPGETVRARTTSEHLGGKGANQAVAAAAAGAPTRIVAAVGDRDGGQQAVDELTQRGVDTTTVRTAPRTRTGRAVVVVDARGENSIVVSPGANERTRPADLAAALPDLGPADLLLLQNEIPVQVAAAAIQVARGAGTRVVWNAAPAPQRPDELLDCDLLIVNAGELAHVSALLADPGMSSFTAVRDGLGIDLVATVGPDGAVFGIAGTYGEVASPSVTAVDTTAAGDTFVGYLCAALVAAPDDPPGAAVRFAACAAALTVTRHGAAASIPTHAEVTAFASSATTTGRTTT